MLRLVLFVPFVALSLSRFQLAQVGRPVAMLESPAAGFVVLPQDVDFIENGADAIAPCAAISEPAAGYIQQGATVQRHPVGAFVAHKPVSHSPSGHFPTAGRGQ
jgi:hypothetical protein